MIKIEFYCEGNEVMLKCIFVMGVWVCVYGYLCYFVIFIYFYLKRD